MIRSQCQSMEQVWRHRKYDSIVKQALQSTLDDCKTTEEEEDTGSSSKVYQVKRSEF